jgi:hypothetical protein
VRDRGGGSGWPHGVRRERPRGQPRARPRQGAARAGANGLTTTTTTPGMNILDGLLSTPCRLAQCSPARAEALPPAWLLLAK